MIGNDGRMNVPNALSLFRLALVPVFPLVYWSGLPNAHLWAAGVYLLASLTDVLDGHLARRLNEVTRLGRVIDPLADKLMAGAVLICIAATYPLLWWAAGVFVAKELLMGVGALIQYKKIDDVPPSEFFGKFSAALFCVACVLILVLRDALSETVKLVLVSAAIACSVVSLVLYLRRFLRVMRAK